MPKVVYAWDCAFKLDQISDTDMYQFIEDGMRGEGRYIAQAHSKVNSKYMKSYAEYNPSNNITYRDANKLYEWAMVQCLTTHIFKWLTIMKDGINKLDVIMIREDNPEGCLLKDDLEYRENFHDLHNTFPLAPGKIEREESIPSD